MRPPKILDGEILLMIRKMRGEAGAFPTQRALGAAIKAAKGTTCSATRLITLLQEARRLWVGRQDQGDGAFSTFQSIQEIAADQAAAAAEVARLEASLQLAYIRLAGAQFRLRRALETALA